MKLFGREPALWIGALSGVLSLGTSLGLDGLSAGQVAAIIALINAVALLLTMLAVRPIGPAVFTNVVAAAAALSAAYGFEVSSEVVGGINVAVLAVLTLLTRGQVSPKDAAQAVAPPAPEPVVGPTRGPGHMA